MQDFSFLDKIKILMNVIVSSPFYIALMISLMVLLFTILIAYKLKKNVNKWIFFIIWFFFLCFVIIIYHDFVLDLLDNLVDTVFVAIYFPNLATYIIILLVSNFLFIYSLFSKKTQKPFKVLNIINTSLIDLLLLFIIGVISKNNINIYEEITVFTNSSLLVLLELSSALFTSWILINLLISAYYKLKVYDKDKVINTVAVPEIIFDWVES